MISLILLKFIFADENDFLPEQIPIYFNHSVEFWINLQYGYDLSTE